VLRSWLLATPADLYSASRRLFLNLEEPQMADMRDSAVTMLYVMKDKMQTASREPATINRIATGG
jgi:hypothetical protein